nr:hypothetical protein [Tanacetum cinerariifolium]
IAPLHQPVEARSRHRHRPGAAGTRALRLLQTVRLQPAAVRDTGIPGQPHADHTRRRSGRSSLHQLRFTAAAGTGERGEYHAPVLDVLPRGPEKAQADYPAVGLHPRDDGGQSGVFVG